MPTLQRYPLARPVSSSSVRQELPEIGAQPVSDPGEGAHRDVDRAGLDRLEALVPDGGPGSGLLLGEVGTFAGTPNSATYLFENLPNASSRHAREKARWRQAPTPQYSRAFVSPTVLGDA